MEKANLYSPMSSYRYPLPLCSHVLMKGGREGSSRHGFATIVLFYPYQSVTYFTR